MIRPGEQSVPPGDFDVCIHSGPHHETCDSEDDFNKSTTDAEEVEVGAQKFRRLNQVSSATYCGRWGSHKVEEPLYREVGVHNGQTIKPVELKVGIIEHMTPDMARVTGALNAELSSQALLRGVGSGAVRA